MPMRLLIFCGTLLVLAARADDTTTSAAPAAPAPATAASLVEQATSDEAGRQAGPGPHGGDGGAGARAAQHGGARFARLHLYGAKALGPGPARLHTLNQISPDPAYQYKLAQIQFLQKQYDDARPLFAALKDDPRLGDLARTRFSSAISSGRTRRLPRAISPCWTRRGKSRPIILGGRCGWARTARILPRAITWPRPRVNSAPIFATSMSRAMPTRSSSTRRWRPSRRKTGKALITRASSWKGMACARASKKGWVTLPLEQLPDDLSGFPDDVHEQIDVRRHSTLAPGRRRRRSRSPRGRARLTGRCAGRWMTPGSRCFPRTAG